MTKPAQKPAFCDLTINVLGYREDEEWVALAMEMDLRGYGKTFAKAVTDLAEQVAIQIGFSEYKGHPDMVLHPAAPELWQLFTQVRQDKLRAAIAYKSVAKNAEAEYQVGGLPLPSAGVIEASRKAFALANA